MKHLQKLKLKQPDYDSSDWEAVIKDVQKLPKDYPEPKSAPLIIDISTEHHISATELKDVDAELVIDSTDNIDNQTAKKFKREEFKVEAVLDLHGQTEKNAYDKVVNFIKQSYADNKRCIIIITGKGINPHNDEDIFAARGILKTAVPNWLNSAEIRPLILAYKHPSEAKGGSGALYILLRRKRG